MGTDITTSSGGLVRETTDADVPALVHHGWSADHAWLVQGTTTWGTPGGTFDLGLFSMGSPEAVVRRNWGQLLAATGMGGAVHARQLHEAEVRWHGSTPSGLHIVGPCDGHATRVTGALLTVSAADCVPVFVVAPDERAVAVLHGGWRGVAEGVLERGLDLLTTRAGADVSTLRVHLGPAICGGCYEVGPEVFTALKLPAPRSRRPLDLRGVLSARAVARGVDPSRLTTSAHCTCCTGSGLFSHRGGDPGRQVGYIGVRP